MWWIKMNIYQTMLVLKIWNRERAAIQLCVRNHNSGSLPWRKRWHCRLSMYFTVNKKLGCRSQTARRISANAMMACSNQYRLITWGLIPGDLIAVCPSVPQILQCTSMPRRQLLVVGPLWCLESARTDRSTDAFIDGCIISLACDAYSRQRTALGCHIQGRSATFGPWWIIHAASFRAFRRNTPQIL